MMTQAEPLRAATAVRSAVAAVSSQNSHKPSSHPATPKPPTAAAPGDKQFPTAKQGPGTPKQPLQQQAAPQPAPQQQLSPRPAATQQSQQQQQPPASPQAQQAELPQPFHASCERPFPTTSVQGLSDEEGGDVLATLPARRLGRNTSVSRPLQSIRPPRQRSGGSNPEGLRAGSGGAARLALERLPSLLPSLAPAIRPAPAPESPYSSEQGVPVHRQQVSIFVVDNNTIISIFEASGAAVTRPLLQQLRGPHTLGRDAADASYLLCLLLDSLADSTYPVVDAYSELVENYEARILGGKPQAGFTRELHLVQQDLATLRRTVLPTLHLVAALRTHASASAWDGGHSKSRAASFSNLPPGSGGAAGEGGGKQASMHGAHLHAKAEAAHPLVSHLTKTYLGDVQDHLTTVLDALDSQIEACRDLIDLAFNLIAHGTNQAMQALTVVSVLFLPLTFLAGIYGMNFDHLPELHWQYGYAYFYGMCGIICIIFLATMYRMGLMWG